ncbi:MAG: ABC transporter substrate-binding protein [Pseudomonadota bacterium]
MSNRTAAQQGYIGFVLSSIIAITVGLPSLAGAQDASRVLAIGGSVTEIVYALGEEERLIARDATSTHPPAAEDLPDVGYMRALSPEGVLSVAPDLIVAEDGAGPPETIELLEAAAIPFVTVPDRFSADGVEEKILAVGDALGVPGKAEALAADVAAKLAAATAAADVPEGTRKRVMFILSTQGGRIMASGTDTAAAAIIDMAGGMNAVTAFDGYKQLGDEAVVAAAPDVILMMDRGGDHNAAADELFAMPAIASTPAAAERALIRMDGLRMLGFGPRTAEAVTALSEALGDS